MLYGIIGILCIVIIFLFVKLNKKQTIDNNELFLHQTKVNELTNQEFEAAKKLATTNADLTAAETHLNIVQEQVDKALKSYNETIQKNKEDLDTYFEEQKNTRQQALDSELKAKQEFYKKIVEECEQKSREEVESVENAAKIVFEELTQKVKEYENNTDVARQRYESLIAPIKQYEMERQQRLFYTIQVPDEYKDDIDFLLTTVSQKVQHPDIVNKLVWNEYVKPYIDDTFRRVGIEDKPGIYKITNLDNGKAYIGKSTNIKKRLADHFKSSIGISSIADQAVHHEILRTGFWNWTLEPIIYCDKDKLNEMEKYYINFFDTVNNGYNKNSGGGG